MAEEFIDVRVRLSDVAQYVAGMDEAAASTARASNEVAAAGVKAKEANSGFGMFSRGAGVVERTSGGLISKAKGVASSWISAGKGLLAAGAAFASFQGIKSAIDTTDTLAITTMRLNRNLGMSTKEAGTWAVMAKARGIDNTQLQRTFNTLSKQVQSAGQGSKQATALFKSMGITTQQLAATHGNFNAQLDLVSNALARMPGGAARAHAAQLLLGRGAISLLPLLGQGSKALDNNRKEAAKYGAQIGGGTVNDVKKMIAAHHQFQYAMIGLQITLGTVFIPLLTKLMTVFDSVVEGIRSGKGPFTVLHIAIGGVGAVLKPVIEFFKQNKTAATVLATTLGVLAGLFILNKGAALAAGAAEKLFGEETLIARLAALAFGTELALIDAIPIVAAVAGIIAIIVLLATHWKQVTAAVQAGWNWIKTAFNDALHWIGGFVSQYWPFIIGVLTGGMALLPALIIKYWHDIMNFFSSLPGWFVNIGKTIFKGIADGFIWAINVIIQAWDSLKFSVPSVDLGPLGTVGGGTISVPQIGTIPYMAEGGVVVKGGTALIGEHGPEILHLPTGAAVEPLPNVQTAPRYAGRSAQTVPLHNSAIAQQLSPTVVAKIFLDKRQIAEAVGEVAQEQKARS